MESTKSKKKQLTSIQIFHIFSQLHVLMGAGITPYAAFKIMKEDSDHRETAAILAELGERIAGGALLSEAVADTGVFPSYVSELLLGKGGIPQCKRAYVSVTGQFTGEFGLESG